MTKNWMYINGELVLGEKATISPYDHGFLYGHGLFETMRVYQGKVFCVEEHVKRLVHSSNILGWTEKVDEEQLVAGIYRTLQKNKLQDASVRLTISRGIGASRPDPGSCGPLTVTIFTAPLQPLASEVYDKGWKMVTATIQRNLTSPLCSLKVANYLDNILAKMEAKKQGAHEALFLNTKGNIAEGTMCNVFFMAEGNLITPDLSSGLLPGITRAIVLELAQQVGMRVEERQIHPEEVVTVTEMFVTSSLLEIMPVTMLDGRRIGNGDVGQGTTTLQRKYKELIPCY